MSHHLRIPILLLCLFVGLEMEAKAYTDPGTGALIWQLIAAGFVGGMFYLRRLRLLVTGFWKKQQKDQ